MSLRSENGGRLPSTKECIKYIETTYGGCTFLGVNHLFGELVYVFDVPARDWDPTTYFSAHELRYTFIHGW